MTESFLLFLVLAIVGGGVLTTITKLQVASPGQALARRFASINPIAGKTRDYIITAVGPPSSISALPHGKTLLQWQATTYHIALRFSPENVCEGITHEHLSKAL